MTTPSTLPSPGRRSVVLLATVLVAVALLMTAVTPALAEADRAPAVTLGAEERERIPIAPTPRSQLALVLYGLMGLGTAAGVITLRRQLKGERPQSDGEFRWR
jgi:hypothetical protein